MKLYSIGEIVYKNKSNIILESKGDGYIVTVADDKRWEVGQKTKLYLFEYRTDYMTHTYGFKEFKERLLFIDLIGIEKVGAKIAMSILEKGWEYVAHLIVDHKTEELASIPFVTERMANLICFELGNKWAKILTNGDAKKAEKLQLKDELYKSLLILGFTKGQIESAVKNVKLNQSLEDMVEESIKFIATQKDEDNRFKTA
ncbi:Holliday junction branch migration protein RuvA [Mycoplasma sp. 4463]|uniref:Holliday junction branch migration protein RuvA n=1 Tax=Mycoplasma sp. 4463 TaxID=3400998 RepID=UPI003AAEAC88